MSKFQLDFGFEIYGLPTHHIRKMRSRRDAALCITAGQAMGGREFFWFSRSRNNARGFIRY